MQPLMVLLSFESTCGELNRRCVQPHKADVLPRATLCAAFLLRLCKKKGKKVGRTCPSNGCAALLYPSAAGLDVDGEECWESEEGKSASPSVPSGGGGGHGTTGLKLMAWSNTPDLAGATGDTQDN